MEKSNLVIDYKNVVRMLLVFVVITNPYTNNAKRYNAIFDTLATRSAVTEKVFDELHLPYIKQVLVSGVNGEKIVPLTLVNITLPNEKTFKNCYSAVCSLSGGADVLLGMDIITKGSFLVDTKQTTVLTFEAN